MPHGRRSVLVEVDGHAVCGKSEPNTGPVSIATVYPELVVGCESTYLHADLRQADYVDALITDQ